MKLNLIWTLALGFTINACAQNNSTKFANTISVKDAKKHLSILASDEFEGRETGKPGAEKAANYIANEFKKLGLTAPVNGSYFQNVPLVESTFEVASFTVNESKLTIGKDFLVIADNAPNNTITVKDIVFVGYGLSEPNYDDLKEVDLTGKVVLLINKGKPIKNGSSVINTSAQSRIQNIASKNPALIIAIDKDLDQELQNYSPPKPKLLLKSKVAKTNSPLVIAITPTVAKQFFKSSGKNYEVLKSAIDHSGRPQSQSIPASLSITYGPKNNPIKAVNVLGFLEGSDFKNEVLVISAHYDHIGLTPEGSADKVNNGADDDASGTTSVIEIAKAFIKAKEKGKGPRRSILFLTVVGEEKGLLGSEYYSENPVFPFENTIADLNIDMIGRIGSDYKNDKDSVNYCYLIGSDKLSTTLHEISVHANATYTKLKLDYKFNDPNDPERIYYRSDHYNFAKHNIPIIFYFNGVHEDYHAAGDEVAKINFQLLVKRTQLVFYTAWELVNRNNRPVVDVKSNMPNSR